MHRLIPSGALVAATLLLAACGGPDGVSASHVLPGIQPQALRQAASARPTFPPSVFGGRANDDVLGGAPPRMRFHEFDANARSVDVPANGTSGTVGATNGAAVDGQRAELSSSVRLQAAAGPSDAEHLND